VIRDIWAKNLCVTLMMPEVLWPNFERFVCNRPFVGLAMRHNCPHIWYNGRAAKVGAALRSVSLERKDIKMTKLTFGAHPFLLGFEQLERLVERTAKTASEGYPPFNIEATTENTYRITLAVAGFGDDDLAITVEDRQLVVRGRQIEDSTERVFLHRGIAARAFQRSFVLADGVEVAGAGLDHGLLNIDLHRSVPETVVQTIRINRK
jgi:HSP20 family molecular chaperone IbpA